MIKKLMKEEKGSALVQTAIVIPIILLMFLGLVLFSNAYRYKIVMSMAAKEGAREYAVSMGDRDEAAKIAKKELAMGGVDADVTVAGRKVKIEKPIGVNITLFGNRKIKLKTEHEFKEELEERFYGKDWE